MPEPLRLKGIAASGGYAEGPLYPLHREEGSYLARGKQYIAVPAGIGGGSWSTLLTPELAPEIRRPNSGNSIMVFALPGGATSGTRSTQ